MEESRLAPKGKYNIKAISNIVGILPGTLRAWERRYNIISPVRNEAGHRLYTEEHVHILKWLLQKVNEGFTIGQAVNLYETKEHNSTNVHYTENNQTDQLINNIVSSLLSFKEYDANYYVNEAFSYFTAEKVMFTILTKVLNKIIELLEKKEITSAHEHFATSFLRNRLGMLFSNLPANKHLPKIIAVCGPNEKHELGLLTFSIFLRRHGYQVIYLGTAIDKKDITIVINEVNPTAFIMSCKTKDHFEETIQLANELVKNRPQLVVGIGGNALINFDNNFDNKIEDFFVGNNHVEWDEWILRNFNIK